MSHTQEPTRLCPLCGGDDSVVIVTVSAEQIVQSSPYYDDADYDRLGVQPGARYGVSKCRLCNFTFASSVPTDEFLEKLYGPASLQEDAVKVFSRPGRAAYAFRVLSKLLHAIEARTAVDRRGVAEQTIKILDVGCAFGVGSLGLIQPHYPYEVAGVELSESTRAYLSSQGMVTYKSLEDVPPGTLFDGILLNDILEHVPDPCGFVTKLGALSHKRTVIWVNVPNFIDWRMAAIVKQVFSGSRAIAKDFNPWEHLSYFSPQSLDVLMKKVGARRLADNPVEYPIACDSFVDALKACVRVLRDIWRIYARRYPQRFTTSGIFVFDE